MIKGLMGKAGVTVSGGDTSLPYITMNSENPIQGMVRVWGTDLQVFNGSSWMTIPSSYATATLDEYSLNVIDWARKKMLEEKVLEALSDDNPAVKIAKENVNRIKQELARAEEQLKITEILSQDE
jgi:hypothetical protein